MHILEVAQKLILRHGYKKVSMTDIAEGCDISRPTLYKSFSNMESIIAGLIELQIETSNRATSKLHEDRGSLRTKLHKFFEAWTLIPASTAIDTEAGRELLVIVASYAPDAVIKLYVELERQLALLLKPELKRRRDLTPEDLAHILALASRGLKASSSSMTELRRLVDGLIGITVAALEK
jgi:AcrR family transcriptional regulator